MLFKRKPKGKIYKPTNGALVPRQFRAEGTIDLVGEGQHGLLVVEVEGLMWPKQLLPQGQTAWDVDIYEGGTPPQGHFSLALYLVRGSGIDETKAWLEHGEQTDDYPGLHRIKKGVRLDRIQLRLKL